MESNYSTKTVLKFYATKQPKTKIWIAVVTVALFILIIIALLFFFRSESNRIFIAKMKSSGVIINNSKNYHSIIFGGLENSDSSTYSTAQLVEEGDILVTQNSFFEFDSKKISFELAEYGDSLTYLNGNIIGIHSDKGDDLLQWLKKMSLDTVKHLQTLMIQSPIPQAYFPYLEKISTYNKTVSILIDGDIDSASYKKDIQTISQLFTPKILYISLRAEDLKMLALFKGVKTLVLDIADELKQSLPSMPDLRQCIVDISDGQFINQNFFINNEQIEILNISANERGWKNIGFISKLDHLKELITNEDVLLNIDSVYKLAPNLTVLILGDTCKNLTALSEFKKIKWLGLPRSIKQKQFDSVLSQLPRLEVLEMCGNDSITNIEAITRLDNLKGLIMADKLSDSSKLLNFKQLRYLSVPGESSSDSIFVMKLQKALPGCIIVPNSGACLGSGWLLLLVPLAALIIYLRNRSENVFH